VILDTSAVIAIAFGEPQFERLAEAVDGAESCSISAATFVEASIVAFARGGHQGLLLCDAVLKQSNAVVQPLTEEQALLARQAFTKFGKGRHAAKLNFGDCFAYALAKAMGEPLLFKGDDFRRTDVTSALA